MKTRKERPRAKQVVVYQSPGGDTVAICPACEARLTAAGVWTHDRRGEQHCQVSQGLTPGHCHVCEPLSDRDLNVW